MRCIDRLRYEYGVPLEFNSTERGYFLTNPAYELDSLPPGKDELTALLLLRDMASLLDVQDLRGAIDGLWAQFAAKSPSMARELEGLSSHFSSDLTSVSLLADADVFPLVNAAQRGDSVQIVYQSPWRHTEAKTYRGRILKVHFSDGTLYLFLHEEGGRGIVLNSSFVRELTILDYTVPLKPLAEPGSVESARWLEGFGVWSGEELVNVEVRILPPASEYYRTQRWHDDQEDTFEEGVLIRRFPSMLSPELVRRILSLGQYVASVEPEALADKVRAQVAALTERLTVR